MLTTVEISFTISALPRVGSSYFGKGAENV